MAIKVDFSKCEIKPPTWSGGRVTCPQCNSNERCSSVGGFYYDENKKLRLKDHVFCMGCGYNKKIEK